MKIILICIAIWVAIEIVFNVWLRRKRRRSEIEGLELYEQIKNDIESCSGIHPADEMWVRSEKDCCFICPTCGQDQILL